MPRYSAIARTSAVERTVARGRTPELQYGAQVLTIPRESPKSGDAQCVPSLEAYWVAPEWYLWLHWRHIMSTKSEAQLLAVDRLLAVVWLLEVNQFMVVDRLLAGFGHPTDAIDAVSI
ncbi:hypothetical protein Fot_37969 [Forsythia ovata]|uniref:Uncharacterized protein n=1 Tax=Forsythia ovata TaxID=205694 RepID=A0ABD1S311_9LAMI